MSWSPGDVVVLREVWADRFLAARPVRVVHAGEDYLSFFFASGTPWKNDPRDHGDVRFYDGPWELEDLVRDRPVLSFAFPETAYAVLLDRTVDGAFDGYYVNLQSPLRAWEGGFDYTDWFLDVVIAPDRASYRWKDEEELAEAVGRGLVTPAQARDVRAAGERAIVHVLDAEPPFDEDWSAWRPDPSWEIPSLPEDWDHAPPA